MLHALHKDIFSYAGYILRSGSTLFILIAMALLYRLLELGEVCRQILCWTNLMQVYSLLSEVASMFLALAGSI